MLLPLKRVKLAVANNNEDEKAAHLVLDQHHPLPPPGPRGALERDGLLHDGDGGALGEDLGLHVHGVRAVLGGSVPDAQKQGLLKHES